MNIKEILKLIAAKFVPNLTVSYGPLKIQGPLEDRGFLIALSKNEREPFMVQTLLSQVKPGTVFLDIGGHLGQYTLLVAQKLKEAGSGSVFVFEPHPRSHKYLSANLDLNKLTKLVKLESCCLSSEVGRITLYSDPLQSDFTSTIPNADGSSLRQAISVETTTVDHYVSQMEAVPTLIKLDVEGAELSVLKGMSETIKRNKPTLFIECNGPALQKAGHSAGELVAVLKSLYSNVVIVDEATQSLQPIASHLNLSTECLNLYCKP